MSSQTEIPDNGSKSTSVVIIGSGALAFMLAALSMLGPFSVDTYLPAFPNIETSLGAAPIEVQQTLTAYMFSFAMMILWHGALADAFGRRNVILISLAIFSITSIGCAAAYTVEYLWLFRVLQGMTAGAGVVIGRAIIRDLYEGPEASRLLSLVTMIFSIAPAIAPIVGGWVVNLFGWRMIFIMLFAYTLILLFCCVRYLPESLPLAQRQPFNPRSLYASYKSVFRSRLFLLKSGTIAFNFAGMFLYVAAAPVFLTEFLGLGATQFAWQFVPLVSGIFCGALTANRLAGRVTLMRQVVIGFTLLVGAASFNLAYHAFFPPAVPWSVAPMFFYTFGMSMIAPATTLLVLDMFPTIRGVAAACQSFLQTLLAALVAGVVAPLLSHSPLSLALGQLACALLGLSMWLSVRRRRRLLESLQVIKNDDAFNTRR